MYHVDVFNSSQFTVGSSNLYGHIWYTYIITFLAEFNICTYLSMCWNVKNCAVGQWLESAFSFILAYTLLTVPRPPFDLSKPCQKRVRQIGVQLIPLLLIERVFVPIKSNLYNSVGLTAWHAQHYSFTF